MEYKGRYEAFDTSRIRTYPLAGRRNKVTLQDMVHPNAVAGLKLDVPVETRRLIAEVAAAATAARMNGRPVILFTGAHLVKNGLGPLVIDLVRRGVLTLVAGNAATAIHDFELALIGQTSEDVPQALERGEFGMAREFAYFNTALAEGNRLKLGFGESLGRTICDGDFRRTVLARLANHGGPADFGHPDVSILAACYEARIPFTVHAGIGTDVTDQHPSFDGAVKGACSGRDFLIFARHVTELAGGVVLNVASAVTGPEVLLKAVSMAANVGKPPHGLTTADFDLRPHSPGQVKDESAPGYYFRDQKSIVTRIPAAFGGKGLYIFGNQKLTLPLLYLALTPPSARAPTKAPTVREGT